MLDLEPLFGRRVKLCRKFAKKTFKLPEHQKIFVLNEGRKTRSGRKVIVPVARTARYYNSAVPSLARIINDLDLD